MFSCSPANPPVCAARESSFSPMIWTFWRCFCGERLRRASSLALSSQSGRPGRRWPPGPAPGRKPGRRGAVAGDGGVGRETGGVALGPSPRGLTGVPSGRRGGGTAGRPVGFCSCMSSPGATGLRIPGGMAGRLVPAPPRCPVPGRPASPRLLLPSRRMGLPTSSRVLPERPAPGRPAGEPGRVGAPGRWAPAGRCGDPPRCPPAATGRGAPGRAGAPGREGAPGRLG